MTTKIILLTLSVLFAIMFLVVRVKVGGVFGVLTKTLASFMFVVTAIYGLTTNFSELSAMFVVLGLLCGFIGDIVLDLKVVYKEHNDIYLNSGMFSFGLGHVFYFVALFTYVCNSVNYVAYSTPIYIPILIGVGIAILLSVVILISTKFLKLNFGKFFYQSGAYTILLTSLSAISIMLAFYYQLTILWLFAIGATFILISDLVLSLNYFGGKENDKLLILLNHGIYYVGQILIASFLLFI